METNIREITWSEDNEMLVLFKSFVRKKIKTDLIFRVSKLPLREIHLIDDYCVYDLKLEFRYIEIEDWGETLIIRKDYETKDGNTQVYVTTSLDILSGLVSVDIEIF